MDNLSYLYGKPQSSAKFKACAEDFVVDEILGFEPSGEGEHVCLLVVKKGENTQYVAKQIAKFAGVLIKDVSYAGLKDRHGVCSQWFSVPVPIKKQIDFSGLNSESVFVLKQVRHNRKLKTGCHKGNQFTIKLTGVSQPLDVLSRINAVRQGVPNYYGPQRFGHDGNNLALAERFFDGEQIRDKKLRSIVISAARSHIFNQLVSKRVAQDGIAKTRHEEVFLLSGSNSFFKEPISIATINRLAEGDLCLSAPLVGKDNDKALTPFEREWLGEFTEWWQKLAELGLKTERRNMRLYPEQLTLVQMDEDSITVSFALEKGCFATSVLRELALIEDASGGKRE